MCNSGFEWVPKIVLEASSAEAETKEPTGSDSNDATLLPVMSAFVPLVLVIVAIGAYFIVDRQRKAARLAAVSLL